MMHLSQHFELIEFTRSTKAESMGIPNNPTGMQIDNLTALCSFILEPIREHFGKPIKILSGFRSAELNKAVGGAPTSQHTKGEAADIEIPGLRNDILWTFIVDNLEFDQCIAEKLKLDDGSAGWVHVSHTFGKQRKEALSFVGNGVYLKGLHYAQ